jgi:hypothetical protein
VKLFSACAMSGTFPAPESIIRWLSSKVITMPAGSPGFVSAGVLSQDCGRHTKLLPNFADQVRLIALVFRDVLD